MPDTVWMGPGRRDANQSAGTGTERPSPDLSRGFIPALASIAEWLPTIVRYPFFGGQLATVALVALVVSLARALSTSADLLLGVAAIGSVLLHSALGALAQSEGLPHQRLGALMSLVLASLILATAVAMTIVLVVWRHGG